MSARKTRADAILKNLPDALQEELFQLLRRNTQEKVIAWLKERHGVSTSAGALSEFWGWYQRCGSLKQAATFADQLALQFAKMPQLNLAAEQAAAITQTVFELQAAQDRDPKLFFALRKSQRDSKKLQLDERKVQILEAKAAAADKAAGIAGDEALTPEQKERRIKAVFGIS